MKSFVVLASFLFFTVVLSASDIGLHQFFLATPENQMAKCLKESNLEAEKDKVLTDETSVDQEKLGCFLACTLKENRALVNGEIKVDVLTGILSKILTEEGKSDKIMALIKSCIPEGANEKNDCDKVRKIIQCQYKKAPEMGL